MLKKINNRWQAFATHLFISLLIFLVLLSIIVFLWYPGVFIHFGGYQGIIIVAGVDLVLGPLLTLIVFNKTKPSLKMDLSIIACLQLSALSYGVWEIYNQQPIFQVLSYNSLNIVTRSELKDSKYELEQDLFDGKKTPIFVALDLPSNISTASNIEFTTELLDGLPIKLRTDLYRSLPDFSAPFFSKAEENKNEEKNCFEIDIISTHLSSRGCLNFSTGLLFLNE